MRTILITLLQIVLASGILYGYYHWMLRNKKFHQYNRFYLLAIVVISFLIPFLHIPVYFSNEESSPAQVFQTLNVFNSSNFDQPVAHLVPATNSVRETRSLSLQDMVYLVYSFITLILLIRIVWSVRKIRIISTNYPSEKIGNIHFVNTDEEGTPFSFFRWLFWNRKIELNSDNGQQIFRHELYHINQRHSADIVFMEVVTAICWFNPFFYLIKRELKAIHEFLADEYAMNKNGNWEYAELLLMQVLNTKYSLVNPFFHNQIKRRIAMITNPKKTSHRYLRKLLVLPVTAFVLILFAFKYKHRTITDADRCIETATIVIDAAHGGIDPGAMSSDGKYSEAALALEISKEIQALAKEYNVKVIMTRESDILPGNASNKKDGLLKRVEICENTKPDVFISLHLNAATTNASANSGFEAYIAGKRESESSRKFAESILQNISGVYKTNEDPKQRHEQGVYVLDKNTYPAVMLQCGYITNAADLSFISKRENQEKVARSILEAVVKLKNSKPGTGDISFNDTIPRQASGKNSDSIVVKEITLEYKDANSEPALEKVEIEPSFPGGFIGWQRYLERNLNAQTGIENHAPSGTYTVYVQFIVRKDGSISSVRPLTHHGYGMEAEAVRIIKKGPGWVPAVQNGQKVNAYRKQPVTFVVGDGKIKYSSVTDTSHSLNEVVVVGYPGVVYDKVDIEPSFPGGDAAWKKYLERNLITDIASRNNAPAGEYTVYLQFVVRTDGTVTDIRPLTNHGFGMEQEAIRLIKKGPKWYPAMQNDVRVSAYKKQRIDFVSGKPKATTQNIPLEKVRSLEQGKTSLAQVVAQFGEPRERSIDGNNMVWNYEGAGSRLAIQFNKTTEIVLNFRYMAMINSQRKNIEYDKAKTIKENQTNLTQLENLLGQPYQIEINNDEEYWTYEGFDSRLNILSKERRNGIITTFVYNQSSSVAGSQGGK